MRTVSVAGTYSIFNRSPKLYFECCGAVPARATEGWSLHSDEWSLWLLAASHPARVAMREACCSSGSASARRVSVPAACKRRRRYVGFQQFVVLKYLADSGPPWEMFSSRKVSVGSVGRGAPQGWSSPPALCFGSHSSLHGPFSLLGMGIVVGLTNINQASCADVSQTETLCLNYFNSNYFIHMHSMYFSYRVRSESVG